MKIEENVNAGMQKNENFERYLLETEKICHLRQSCVIAGHYTRWGAQICKVLKWKSEKVQGFSDYTRW